MNFKHFRDVRKKVAIVTGAARGIGRGIAETLIREGVQVVIADIRPLIHQTIEEINQSAPEHKGYAVELDVADEEAVQNLIEEAVKNLGKLDIMINNAGMHADTGNVWETEVAKLDRVMAVNFKGVFFGCKYASRQMIKQKNGSIINIGSFFGKVGHAGSGAYGASKGALHTMTQSLALELAPYGINVNALCPGLAASEMHWDFMEIEAKERSISFEELKEEELQSIPLGRYGEGKDMAGAIIWLSTPSGSYVTGQLININGGLDFT